MPFNLPTIKILDLIKINPFQYFFKVSIFSDIMPEPILEDKTNEYWYNDYLPAGVHDLSFVLTDSTGRISNYSQQLTVFETGPTAGISDYSDGQYIPPGREITLNASASFDYDNDIILYQWSLGDGTEIGDKEEITVSLPPGLVQINLLVKDSRGESDISSINLIIGSSSPILYELSINPNNLKFGESNPIFVTVRLDDLDGTTQMVFCKFKAGAVEQEFELRDDGLGGDSVAGDNIWSLQTALLVNDGSIAQVEVWAIDGEVVSPILFGQLPIKSEENNNIISWFLSGGLPLLAFMITLFLAIGILYSLNRRKELAKDLEMIESWSTFDPRELDDEFNE